MIRPARATPGLAPRAAKGVIGLNCALSALSALCVLCVLCANGCSGRRSEPLRGQLDVSDAQVARGQRVYMERCDKCHPGGDAGLGPAINNKPLPGFMIEFQARHGLGAMPAFTEEEIPGPDMDAVTAYLKALRRNG